MLTGSRIAAIVLIFFATCFAWVVLGNAIDVRTTTSDAQLKRDVASTWGEPQAQQAPTIHTSVNVAETTTEQPDGRKVVEVQQHVRQDGARLDQSRLRADLSVEHRQKGLLWYSTYRVDFRGEYKFTNDTDENESVLVCLPLPAKDAIYDNLTLSLNGTALEPSYDSNIVRATGTVPAGETGTLQISYASQGLDSWAYVFGSSIASVNDFELAVTTNFDAVDFAANSLSPSEKQRTDTGWLLRWDYDRLLSGYRVQIDMPEKLQPGPLAGRISFFAPVSLLFFFFVLFMVTTLWRIDLHPINYFFLAAAFFAFHLLFAYLVDHISIHVAFAISAVVSLFLVVSYLRLVVGMRFAAVEAGGAQFLYLILFSYAFFFKGFTGLTITIGAILTLFVAMQLTGRVRWGDLVSRTEA